MGSVDTARNPKNKFKRMATGGIRRQTNEKTPQQLTNECGAAFAKILISTTEPGAAVDSWRLDHQELLQPLFELEFFEAMMTNIAKELLLKNKLGVGMR